MHAISPALALQLVSLSMGIAEREKKREYRVGTQRISL